MAAATPALEAVKSWRCFDGTVTRYRHASASLGLSATFIVFMPRQNADAASTALPVPALFFLSGLTCTDENFITKAGAQQHAAAHGIALVCPDTSPRGANFGPLETASWDLGMGAGFYVDATQEPWRRHYRMASYLDELRELVVACLPIDGGRLAIAGHSMGGMGALATAMRRPGVFKCASAFNPIAHPSACPWGDKAFTAYLGADRKAWDAYDPTALAGTYAGPPLPILIDQGGADEWLAAGQLLPAHFTAAAASNASLAVQFNEHAGYDHGYYFVSTFIGAHVAFAAKHVGSA